MWFCTLYDTLEEKQFRVRSVQPMSLKCSMRPASLSTPPKSQHHAASTKQPIESIASNRAISRRSEPEKQSSLQENSFCYFSGVLVHDIIHEERTPLFLAAAFSPEDAADECGLLLEEAVITEEWLLPQEFTEAEKADPDYQYDINPDWENGDPPAEGIYLTCKPDHPQAHKYLRVVAARSEAPAFGFRPMTLY